MAREWSKQQQEIFAWFADSKRTRGVVRARAGTGKTTTIIEGLSHAPEKRMLLCAFNKRIAEELSRKISTDRAEAKTLHGVGFAYVRRNWETCRVDGSRGKRLALEACGGQAAPDAMVALVAKLAGLVKEMAPHANTPAEVLDVAEDMDCLPDEDWEDDGWTPAKVAKCALRAMDLAAKKDGTCDFSDMLWLPLRHGWARGQWDLVVVDECQDMNAAQIELALKSVRKGGRVLVVGDDRQAIYGFRGADSGSLDRLKAAMGAEELPLTVTYRCPKAVVAEAQRLVPDYLAAESAPAGVVETMPLAKLAKAVTPGDFVLSRKNAPLVRTCLSILRVGTRAKVEGRDVGKGLVALVKKLKAKSMPNFLERLEAWEAKEVARALKLKPERAEVKRAEIEDQAETLRALADGLSGIPELEARIESLFADVEGAPSQVVCSTVHRSKGLEAANVFILKETLVRRGKDGKPLAQSPEEANIEYVAITRAQQRMVWVDGDV